MFAVFDISSILEYASGLLGMISGSEILEYSLGIVGLCGSIAGFSFWLAALKIKSEINLEVTKQLSQISINQLKQEHQDNVQLSNLLVKIRGWIDKNALEVGKIRQQLDQIERFLERNHDYHRRPILPDDVLPEDTQL